jgi:hypothetical protein
MAVTYAALIGVFANLAPGYILGVRSDTAEVDLFQNLAQGTISYMQYRCHTVTLPDERKFRALRVYIKGTGTVTNGSVVFTFDNDPATAETYAATSCYNDPVAQVLMQQQCLGTKTAREVDVTITIGGTDIIINELLWDIVEIE